MSENMSQNNQPDQMQEPIIPPALLIGAAAVAFLAAFGLAFTRGVLDILTIAALGIGIASLIGWALFAPQQFRAFISGRAVRFGGVSLVVTIIFIVALVAVYSVVKARNWRLDVTQQDTFTLTEAGREVMASLGADPRVTPVTIYAFYGVSQAGQRDQDSILLEDYRTYSSGKVTYEFVDPDKNPVLAEQVGVARAGQIAVVGTNQDGTPDYEGAQLINLVNQEQLTNAVLRVAATGDFRAYVLTVEEGLTLEGTGTSGLSTLNQLLTSGLEWKAQAVSYTQLASGEVDLNDPLANGSVLIIPGGQSPLADDVIAFLRTYVAGGGDLVILADVSLEAGEESLATADNLNAFLRETYGVSFNSEVVLTTELVLNSEFEIYTRDINLSNPITQSFATIDNPSAIFELPHPIEIAETLPESVTVTTLVSSEATTYTKSVDQLLVDDRTQQETDEVGPFVLGATAENTATGSRLVLFGSRGAASDRYADYISLNVMNIEMALRSLVWATNFEDFFSTLPPSVTRESRPQDTPIFASTSQITTINLITVLLMPFGTLAIGFYVWWSRRARVAREK